METKELQVLAETSFTNRIANTIEQAIILEFPRIENLSVETETIYIGRDKQDISHISFTGGATKEDVEIFLTKFKKSNRKQK